MRPYCIALVFLMVLGTLSGSGEQQPSAAPGQAAKQATEGGRGAGWPQPDPIDFDDHPGWTQMFDGQSLNGWDGNPDVWKVSDGAIIGEFATPAGTSNGQTFLIWKGGQLADFELKLEIKLEGPTADSGIQYRAYLEPPGPGPAGGGAGQTASSAGSQAAAVATPPITGRDAQWILGGYQFDFSIPGENTGALGEAGKGGRMILANRGQIIKAQEGKKPRLLSTVGSLDASGGYYKAGNWNQVYLIAHGNTFIQIINGRLIAMLIDEDTTKFRPKGLIGLQCAGSGPVKISFRNIWLRKL